jgi:hypothetical protein
VLLAFRTNHSTGCTVCKARISPRDSAKYNQIWNNSELAKRKLNLCDGSRQIVYTDIYGLSPFVNMLQTRTYPLCYQRESLATVLQH